MENLYIRRNEKSSEENQISNKIFQVLTNLGSNFFSNKSNNISQNIIKNFIESINKIFGICIKFNDKDSFKEDSKTFTINPNTFCKNIVPFLPLILLLLTATPSFASEDEIRKINDSISIVDRKKLLLHLFFLCSGITGGTLAFFQTKNFIKTKSHKEKVCKLADEIPEAIKGYNTNKLILLHQDIMTALMGELPVDLELLQKNIEIKNSADVYNAHSLKKKIDKKINSIVENAETLTKLPDVSQFNFHKLIKLKNSVYILIEKYLIDLDKIKNKLCKNKNKFLNDPNKESNIYFNQILFEEKKIEHTIIYLKQLLKYWIAIARATINESIKSEEPYNFNRNEQLEISILKRKFLLRERVKRQPTINDDEFNEGLKFYNKGLLNAEKKAQKIGIPGFKNGEKNFFGTNYLIIENYGIYKYPGEITYWTNKYPRSIKLAKNCEVQIWVTYQNIINLNFIHNNKTIDQKKLELKNKLGKLDLFLKGTLITLSEYCENLIKELPKKFNQNEIETQQKFKLAPESIELIKSISKAAEKVSIKIENKSYQNNGLMIDIDKEAIDFQQLIVHREIFSGKEYSCLRFRLTKNYRKKALALLKTQDLISNSPININFETPETQSGGTGKRIFAGIQMFYFNININNKTIPILVSADDIYQSLAGEVKILLDPKIDFNENDYKKLLFEIGYRLGISEHLKPGDYESKKTLYKRLKFIKKESGDPMIITQENPEVTIAIDKIDYLNKLLKKKLHSVYFQTNIENLETIFENNGIMSPFMMCSKGICYKGINSALDMQQLGGTYIKTRLHTKLSHKKGIWYNDDQPALVFDPLILLRLDCYGYYSEKWGSKNPSTFEQRISPSQLLDLLDNSYNPEHEVLFKNFINILKHIKFIVYKDPAAIIKKLENIEYKANNLENAVLVLDHKINGIPLKNCIITPYEFKTKQN